MTERTAFISFEGGEGTGKSTQVRLLADRLRAYGHDVLVTREPGGSPYAERIRELLLSEGELPHAALAEALLFNAARVDHLEATIRPALAAGKWVICDRFADSTTVYQGIAGTVPRDVLASLDALVVGGTRPVLTVILDLPAADGLERAASRRAAGGSLIDPYEQRALDYHERLREGFLAVARADPARCVVVDASPPPEVIAAAIWDQVIRRLPVRAV